MADITITAASVVAGSDSVQEQGIIGETITAGQAVYQNSTDRKWYKADNNSATAEVRIAKGIALNGGGVNQPLRIHREGDITIGGTMTAGVAYYLGDTPGGICPVADLASGEYPCLMGIAKSTTVLSVKIHYSGVAL